MVASSADVIEAPDHIGDAGRPQPLSVAGGRYLWKSRAAGEAFHCGAWLEGIVARYGAPPRIAYFDTFDIADVPSRQAATFND